MQECLELAPEEIDLRQGSVFYDAVAAACVKIAQYYADLRFAFDLVFVATAVDEYLDRRGVEYAVIRLPATVAQYDYSWTGTTGPKAGARFFSDGLYFTLRQKDGTLYLEAETPGIASNNILSGTAAIPVNNIAGLATSTFGELIEPGSNSETDENYRDRIMEKIAGPAENGNRQHYKTWAESVAGVGRARIIPLFAGENTVMAVIIGTDGLPAAGAIVERVQEYIDPIINGKVFSVGGETIIAGDGLGDGVANIGAHFAAIAPKTVVVDVSFDVEVQSGTTFEQLKDDFSFLFVEHLKNLALTTPEGEKAIVRFSAVSSLVFSLTGIRDYNNLTLNGAAKNVELTDRQVAVCGEVRVNVII